MARQPGNDEECTAISFRPTEKEKTLCYKPGSIRRVKLKNFLTYSDVEFCPGPRLNIVIGPNGTGKSTILCAICLGLGGQPPLLGRSDDARLFIMHDRDVAEIEIELTPHHDKSNFQTHVIRRVIDRSKGATGGRGVAASSYFINNETVNIKAIQKLVKQTYHIAIDNLCTFLPQDRVGSFSGFDSKMLLAETQKSLSGSQHLYQQHQTLINLEEELLSSGSNFQSIEDKLKRLETENEHLEREKDLMEERKKHMEKLKLYEQKLAWVFYDNTRDKCLQLKAQKKELRKEKNTAEQCLKPLKNRIAQIDRNFKLSIARSKEFDRALQNARKQHDAGVRKAEYCQDQIESETVNLTEIDSMQRRAEVQVMQKREKLNEIQQLLNDYPPEEELTETRNVAFQEMKEFKKQMIQAKRDAERKQMEFKDKRNERDELKKKLENMQDDKARRNERIFNYDTKLRETYNWVHQNRKMFRRPVWGPVVCEIATKTDSTAACLEQHVPNFVLRSFVVECKEDYNLLYREVRQKRKMHINIQTVDHGKLRPVRRKYSRRIEILKSEHGVLGYLDEFFSAPDAILQALRDVAGVDSVLIGNSKTFESLDKKNLLDYLSKRDDGSEGLQQSCIFASDRKKSQKFTCIISRYSGKASIRVDDINRARMLSPGVSPEQKEVANKQLNDAEKKLHELSPVMDQAADKYDLLQRDGQKSSFTYKDAKKAIEELKRTKTKVNMAKKRLHEAEQNASKDNESEKRQHIKELKNQVSNYISHLESASEKFDEVMKAETTLTGIRVSEDGLRGQHRMLGDRLDDKESQWKKLCAELDRLGEEYTTTRQRLNRLKETADRIAPITDGDNDLPLKAALVELPDDEAELRDLIEDSRERANSIHDNPEVLRRYDEQKREIDQIRQDLEHMNESKDAKKNEIDVIRDPWEASLTENVKKVNNLFTKYMKELGNAGEINVWKGEKSEDNFGNFKDWGVEIKVKFREMSELQVLSAQVHSGGERSVSTIMYLMAMQDLMVSPFRCVDEINQGLDERNERLVFRRIVKNSTKPPTDSLSDHSGQYFLITPKLLPNLTDMENESVTILCIFNGNHNFNHYGDWNVESFLQSRKRLPSVHSNKENLSPETTREARKKRKIT